MAEGLFDFFSRARGQERRAALEGLLTQFIPPELRPQLGLLAEATPTRAAELAGQSAGRMVQPGLSGWDRMAAAGDVASNMAAVLAPVGAASKTGVPAANAIAEALTAVSPMKGAVDDFLVDEFGGVGFRAYHGSPHDFDRFSLDKIGTGEGAQAYGHGLYFTETPEIARNYRDMGGDFSSGMRIGGRDIQDFYTSLENQAARMPAKDASATYDKMALLEDLMNGGDALYIRDQAANGAYSPEAMQWFEAVVAPKFKNERGLYEVNINADPADFLDWDKPLSEQPAKVREALGPRVEALRQAGAGLPQDPIGEALWRVAHPQGGFDKTDFSRSVPEQATERLREAGIPGIRYLDAGSRGAGDGSRNYVVFDDKLIEIVRKYGIAGAATLLGISQADVVQAMQQQQQPQTSGLLGGPQ